MVLTAGTLAGGVGGAVGDALVVGLGAGVVGDGEGVLGRVGLLAGAADAPVYQGILERSVSPVEGMSRGARGRRG